MGIRQEPHRRPHGRGPTGKLSISLSSLSAHYLHFSSELAQRLDNLLVDAAIENASSENRWCQLQGTVRSTALSVLGRARDQHRKGFDDNDTAISNPFAENNRLHKTYVDSPTDDNKTAFYAVIALCNSCHSRFRTPRRLAKPRRFKGTRAATSRTSGSKLSTVRQSKQLLLCSAPTAVPYSLRRRKLYSNGLSTSEAASTVPPPFLTSQSLVCLKWGPTSTSTSRPLSTKSPGRAAALQREGASITFDPAKIYKHGGLQRMDNLTTLFHVWR
ncbi:hypothetical protein SprV_0100145600 [Sparganum proliferum]